MAGDGDTLRIDQRLTIPMGEIDWQAVRSQGAGGQNVNKVSSAIHLRFDIAASSLPESVKTRLAAHRDKRITRDGTIVIKAQTQRRQEQNLEDALQRLATLIREAIKTQPPRRPTRPTRGSVKRRLESKTRRSRVKAQRGRVDPD